MIYELINYNKQDELDTFLLNIQNDKNKKFIYLCPKNLIYEILKADCFINKSIAIYNIVSYLKEFTLKMDILNTSAISLYNYFGHNDVAKYKSFLTINDVITQVRYSNGMLYNYKENKNCIYQLKNQYINDNDLFIIIFDEEDDRKRKIKNEVVGLNSRYIKTIKNVDINIKAAFEAETEEYIKDKDIKSYKWRISALFNFISSDRYIKKGNNVNRIYHSISNISAISRKFLNIEFNNIDIMNCQPMLLLYFLKQKGLQVDDNYYTDCVDGIFYERFLEQTFMIYDNDKQISYKKYFGLKDRKEIKVELYRSIYFNFNKKTEVNKKFKELYPITWESYNTFLAHNEGISSAKLLQDLEAELILPITPPKSSNWFNLHDAIYFNNIDDLPYLMSELKNTFKKIGIELKKIKINEETTIL